MLPRLGDGCDAIAINLKAGAMFQDGRVGTGMQLEKACQNWRIRILGAVTLSHTIEVPWNWVAPVGFARIHDKLQLSLTPWNLDMVSYDLDMATRYAPQRK